MQRQRIILIIGIILALVVVFLIKSYLDQQRQIYQEEAGRQAAKKQETQTAILVAKQDIPRGTAINPDMLETKIFPREYIVPQAASSLDRIAGMITIAPISKGEQITLSKLAYSRQTGGLAEATPVGKRAITINVDNMASLAGMIKPGDYVDVIATLPVPALTADGKQATQIASMPLFQNVLVLAVGQKRGAAATEETGGRYSKAEQESKEGRGGEMPSLITLALNPQEANFVAFIQEQQGRFRLVLRSPADSQTQPLRPVTWETLFQYLVPKEVTKTQPKEEEPIAYVDIYRGLKKERIPLAK